MNQPLISVIVPVYNVEKYLYICIDSILAQTYTNFELLLIDDGSPDNSGKICDGYAAKDSRIRVFHQKNGGVSSARNLGIDNSVGEWIVFVDSDDYIELDFLESVVYYYERNTKVDSIIFPSYKNKNNGQTIIDDIFDETKIVKQQQIYSITRSFTSKLASIYSKLYNSKIIKERNIRFIDSYVYEDCIFNTSYFQYASSILYVNIPYYHYMIYQDIPSLSRITLRSYKSYCISIQNACNSLFSCFEKLNLDKEVVSNICSTYQKNYWKGYQSLYREVLDYKDRKHLIDEYNYYFRRLTIKYNFSYKILIYKFIVNKNINFLFKDTLLKVLFNENFN